MKKIMVALMVVLCLFSFTSCHKTKPGYATCKVNMSGSDKGSIEILTTGRHAFNPITDEMHDFPTFTVNTEYEEAEGEEFIFQSSEGMKVEADIGVSYRFDEANIEHLYRTYRQGPDEIRNVVVKNTIRDSFNKVGSRYVVDDIIGAQKEEIINEVYKDVRDKLLPYGIEIQTVSWLNPPRPPQSVIDALNLKVEASQKALQIANEVAQTEAEAEKQKIEIDVLNYQKTSAAEAEADSIRFKAEAEADAIKMKAAADAEALKVTGEAEAAAIKAKLEAEAAGNEKLSASMTEDLIEYTKMNNWDGANPKIVGANTTALIVGDKISK